jgi:hypothetical protein
MELVEGPTLAERIARGPVPLEEALSIAKQIADALEAAHEKGIVHRDLKPANIKIRPDSSVKVLDFGLAKSGEFAEPTSDSPTMLTVAGMILGTAAYMAPEQARGEVVDKRADIWAFGVVLYEMLTAHRLFDGRTVSDTLASVIKDEPDWTKIPAKVQRLLRACLQKDPRNRLHDVADAKLLLEESGVAATDAVQPVAAPSKKLRLWQSAAALLALVALSLAGWMFRPKAEPPAQITRFQVPLPENTTFDTYVSLSPDGRKLVFNATGTQSGLWIRDLDALEWRRRAGTEGAQSPFWSPDSRFLGFSVQNQIKKIDVAGGPAQTLGATPTGIVGTGAWNRDGIIVFGGRGSGPLWKIPQAGGVPMALTAVDSSRGELFHALPTFMPDGKHFIYLRFGRQEVGGIYAGSLDAKPEQQSRERILASRLGASYVNGYLFFMRENTLMAQPFDAGRLQLRGDPVPVAERLTIIGATGVFSVSPGGALAYRTGTQNENYLLT